MALRNLDDELRAIQAVCKTLDELPEDARRRALEYAVDRYTVPRYALTDRGVQALQQSERLGLITKEGE